MARILVCDDAAFMRMAIKDALESAGHEIAGEAEDPDQAASLFKKLKPDIVTMDLMMKGSGIDGVRKIKKIDPGAKIIIVSVFDEKEGEMARALHLGVSGIVNKAAMKQALAAEVNRALAVEGDKVV